MHLSSRMNCLTCVVAFSLVVDELIILPKQRNKQFQSSIIIRNPKGLNGRLQVEDTSIFNGMVHKFNHNSKSKNPKRSTRLLEVQLSHQTRKAQRFNSKTRLDHEIFCTSVSLYESVNL